MHIRVMIRRDFPEILEIENLCFPHPWEKEHFIDALRQRNIIGSVCETPKVKGRGEDVIGHMIYEPNKTNIFIHSLAVHPSCWRRGVGRLMVSKLISKLSFDRRTELVTFTSSENYPAHMFLKAMGFRCVETIDEEYEFKFDLLQWHDDAVRARQTDGRA